MNLFNLLYELKEKKIYLWKNETGDLSFSTDKNNMFTEYLKENLKKNKVEILEILSFNNINSKEKAKNIVFYKVPVTYRGQKLCTIQKGMYVQSNLDTEKHTYNVPLFIKLKEADNHTRLS